MENFEQSTPDYDCRAYTICEIEKTLAFFTGYEVAEAPAILLDFLYHNMKNGKRDAELL